MTRRIISRSFSDPSSIKSMTWEGREKDCIFFSFSSLSSLFPFSLSAVFLPQNLPQYSLIRSSSPSSFHFFPFGLGYKLNPFLPPLHHESYFLLFFSFFINFSPFLFLFNEKGERKENERKRNSCILHPQKVMIFQGHKKQHFVISLFLSPLSSLSPSSPN